MDKKTIRKVLLITIALMVVFPIIINLLMQVSIFPKVFPVVGDEQIWISLFGTFWGAIIGGVIAGVLTLYGVNKTISASFKGLEISANQQKENREIEIELNTLKERLKELYHPAYALESSFILKYGAHDFQQLTIEEQKEYILLLNKNIIYADFTLDQKFLELKWAFRDSDYTEANRIYIEISDLISEELMVIRETLKLPRIQYYFEDNK